MIKKLKTIEKIKEYESEYWESSYGIHFHESDSLPYIDKIGMGNLFGKRVEVRRIYTSDYYQWKLENKYKTGFWAFCDSWFEPDIELVEDELFEV